MAPTATPMPMDICVIMLKKLVAELNSGFGMSAKASVDKHVNCIERHSPFTKSTARMMVLGVEGNSSEQPSIRMAVSVPFQISTERNPNRLSINVVAGFMLKLPANNPSSNVPD